MGNWYPRLTRRRFLGLAAATAGVGLYTWRVEPHWVEVVEKDMPIACLPAALAGCKLVQISDLHVGPTVDTNYLIDCMKLISSLRPDMTVITGDFMTCWGGEQIDNVVPVLRHLVPGSLGIFAILGNHDYASGSRHTYVADKLVEQFAQLGIQTLRNASIQAAGLQLVGLDDLWGPFFNPGRAFAEVDWDGPVVTLCHNPDAVDLPSMTICRGWILSGHTHGGQCKPPFLPPPLLPVRNKRYTAGEFDVGFGRRLYINRGLGYLRRVRFNVRPEITLFHLREA